VLKYTHLCFVWALGYHLLYVIMDGGTTKATKGKIKYWANQFELCVLGKGDRV